MQLIKEVLKEIEEVYANGYYMQGWGVQRQQHNSLELSGIQTVLNNLRTRKSDYSFVKLTHQKFPFDVLGIKKMDELTHISLSQVETHIYGQQNRFYDSKREPVKSFIQEIQYRYVKATEDEHYNREELLITTGYVAVEHREGRNRIVYRKPYRNTYRCGLFLFPTWEKTILRNYIHK